MRRTIQYKHARLALYV